MKRLAFAALVLASITTASPAAAQGACSRELLQGIANDWVEALEKGTPYGMNLGEWVDYQENMEIGFLSAFFEKPRKVEAHRALLDTASCKVFVQSVISDPERPMVLATQLTNGFFGVSPIENLVTDAGDWQFDPQAALARLGGGEAWAPVPEAQRQSREQLIAAAEAYLDSLAGTMGEATERRLVVDETLGAVSAFVQVGPDRRPENHTLKVTNGQVTVVHIATPAAAR
jgi:hypothetical protein